MDLKKQLLKAWQEKLDLHNENQRLQALLDRRQSLIDEQQIQLDELLERPVGAAPPQPDNTAERYRFEEKTGEGGLLASERSLNIRHRYASSSPERETADSHARATRRRVSKRQQTKKKLRAKAQAERFLLEISDLEDTADGGPAVRDLTDRFARHVLRDTVVSVTVSATTLPPVQPAAAIEAPTTTATGSSGADRVILPLPSRNLNTKKEKQGSSLVRPLPNAAIGQQRTESNIVAHPMLGKRSRDDDRDDHDEEDGSGRKRGRLT
ncbi:hypothetical protein ABW21_db0208966 [Orbilia brochopaga]|nr:hypothetical protein ABW21_db0208966 [Drechslerella brochopaga]